MGPVEKHDTTLAICEKGSPMLGDSLTLVDNTTPTPVEVTVAKINQDGYSSEYLFRDTTSRYRVRVRHSVVKATASRPAYDRHNVEIVQTIFATESVPEFDRKAYIVVECLASDDDTAVPEMLCNFIASDSGATLTSLLGWES